MFEVIQLLQVMCKTKLNIRMIFTCECHVSQNIISYLVPIERARLRDQIQLCLWGRLCDVMMMSLHCFLAMAKKQ